MKEKTFTFNKKTFVLNKLKKSLHFCLKTEKQARHVFVFALLSRIITLYSSSFFLNEGKGKVDIFLSTEDFVDFDNGYIGQRYRLYISSRVMSLLSLAFSIIHGLKPNKEKKRYGGIF